MLLENDAFLTELTKLYQAGRISGSVYVTMKRYDGRTKPHPRANKSSNLIPTSPSEYKCLFRASLGKKKISTIVSAKDINKFQMAYSSVMKGNMDNLKKKGKKSAPKATC